MYDPVRGVSDSLGKVREKNEELLEEVVCLVCGIAAVVDNMTVRVTRSHRLISMSTVRSGEQKNANMIESQKIELLCPAVRIGSSAILRQNAVR